jgi:hypothetical protein
MLNILKSVIITVLISLGIAFSLKSFFGFWETFVLFSIIQIGTGYLWNTGKLNKADAIMNEDEQTIDELIKKQEVEVECPCGKNKINTIIFVNDDIVLQCEKCNNSFRVLTEVKTQLLTETVNMEQVYDKLKGTTV